jgi:hypothetical protein
LNFNQLIASHDIDAIAADALLQERSICCVALLQLAMERGFHDRG